MLDTMETLLALLTQIHFKEGALLGKPNAAGERPTTVTA